MQQRSIYACEEVVLDQGFRITKHQQWQEGKNNIWTTLRASIYVSRGLNTSAACQEVGSAEKNNNSRLTYYSWRCTLSFWSPWPNQNIQENKTRYFPHLFSLYSFLSTFVKSVTSICWILFRCFKGKIKETMMMMVVMIRRKPGSPLSPRCGVVWTMGKLSQYQSHII